jgi:hypothetical protein
MLAAQFSCVAAWSTRCDVGGTDDLSKLLRVPVFPYPFETNAETICRYKPTYDVMNTLQFTVLLSRVWWIEAGLGLVTGFIGLLQTTNNGDAIGNSRTLQITSANKPSSWSVGYIATGSHQYSHSRPTRVAKWDLLGDERGVGLSVCLSVCLGAHVLHRSFNEYMRSYLRISFSTSAVTLVSAWVYPQLP